MQTIYRLSDGAITYCAPSVEADAGEGVLEGAFSGATHWVDAGVVMERPAMPTAVDKTTIAADGADVATISGVPAGATIVVYTAFDDGTRLRSSYYDVTDGVFEVLSMSPARMTIEVRIFPYLDGRIEVVAE